MKQEDRLLIEPMIFLQTQNGGSIIVDTTPALRLQDTKSYAQALKDVGELLEDEPSDWGECRLVALSTIEVLKQGNMPGGGE